MIVENQRSGLAAEYGAADRFPVGMRVLAVDDDPICLKVLENLLRKCKYHVTTTNLAIQALKMLRENKNMFDLVISDVNMPDMDGFKLLELMGLEMDLPVIMLSAHSDTELVMKGVTHGACDYLLKPVRIEELKNIWQHVIRRRKFDSKRQNNSLNQNTYQHGNIESEQAFSSTENGENGKQNRKRKDQNEDEEEEGEETEHENGDPSTQKKPRVVWSIELHRKFVAAVHQLGLDKAVPKKILDLMNVEGLSRENVASHLQKYRLYLKRISSVATQQTNIAAALGVKDASYMRIGTIDGFGDLCSLAGNGRFSSTPLSSYPPSGMLGRLNTPASLTLHGITSSGLIQQSNSQNLNDPVSTLGKVEPRMLSSNQTPSIFQGIPTSLQISQMQPEKSSSAMKEFNPVNSRSGFTLTNNSISTSPLILQGSTTQVPSRRVFGAESFAKVVSSNQESFNIGINGSNNLDHNRCDAQMSSFPLTPFETYPHDHLTSNNMSISSNHSHIGRIPVDFSTTCAVLDPTQNSNDGRFQEGLIGNVVQARNVLPKQRLQENKHDFHQYLNHSYNVVDCMGSSGFLGSGMEQNNAAAGRKIFDVSLSNQLITGGTSLYAQHGNSILHQVKPQDGAVLSNYESFDDVMNAMIKQEQNETSLMDEGFGINAYSLGM